MFLYILLRNKGLISDGQQFHQYQHLPLTSNHSTPPTEIPTYFIVNSGPGGIGTKESNKTEKCIHVLVVLNVWYNTYGLHKVLYVACSNIAQACVI
jgi:hypothetical protein